MLQQQTLGTLDISYCPAQAPAAAWLFDKISPITAPCRRKQPSAPSLKYLHAFDATTQNNNNKICLYFVSLLPYFSIFVLLSGQVRKLETQASPLTTRELFVFLPAHPRPLLSLQLDQLLQTPPAWVSQHTWTGATGARCSLSPLLAPRDWGGSWRRGISTGGARRNGHLKRGAACQPNLS